MKKSLRLVLVLFFLMAIIPSCELVEDCKTCKLVTFDGSTELSRGTGIIYCGEELKEKESKGTFSVGGNSARYECE
jgi:hypothetical protein